MAERFVKYSQIWRGGGEVEEENIVDWVFDCYAEWLLSSSSRSYLDWSAAILQIFTELPDHRSQVDRRLIVTEKRICFSQIKYPPSESGNLLAVWSQLRAGCILSRFSDFRPKYPGQTTEPLVFWQCFHSAPPHQHGGIKYCWSSGDVYNVYKYQISDGILLCQILAWLADPRLQQDAGDGEMERWRPFTLPRLTFSVSLHHTMLCQPRVEKYLQILFF